MRLAQGLGGVTASTAPVTERRRMSKTAKAPGIHSFQASAAAELQPSLRTAKGNGAAFKGTPESPQIKRKSRFSYV